MLKKILLTLLICSTTIFAQTERKKLYGVISDSLGELENVHIFNLTTKEATYSNLEGEFRIFAKESDSLKITSIGYTTKLILLKKSHFGLKEMQIHLKKRFYELDEVVVKKHQLTGSLELDFKKTPQNYKDDLVNNLIDNILKLDPKEIANMPIERDELHLKEPSISNGIHSYKGIRIAGGSLDNNYQKKKRELKKSLERKEKFPKRIIAYFGTHFFIKDLQIPKENIYHFIDYCSHKNIMYLFKEEKILDLIKVLQEESITYLTIIEQQK